ncbi:glycosyltransferase family 4 protein [Treponema sp. R6D11]
MTKKLNLLYDATIFANSYIKGSSYRTGIYFAAYNILKYFADDQHFNITLYVHDSLHNAKYFKKDILLSRFPVCLNSKETPVFNIGVHKRNIKTTNNIIKKIIYGLKILKNYLFMFVYNRNNKALLKSIDIFFSPMCPVVTELTSYPNIKHFIVLHDMIPVIFYKDSVNLDNDRFSIIINSLNKNTYYLCNSNHTKNDFLKYYGDRLDEKKTIVIHHATSQNFYPDYDKTKLATALNKYKIKHKDSNKYIFSLCNLEPRKNLLFTVKCFIKFISKHNIQDLYFYLGGSQWNKFILQLENEIEHFNEYRDKIAGLGYVNDSDVNVLYSNSLFFTFISKYEGFGVPPLEAMQAGTPVITSNSSSLPEVVGDAAITIDPDSEDQCIKAFEDLYFNEGLRKTYIEKGLERAKLFSWEKTANKMKEVIIEAVA